MMTRFICCCPFSFSPAACGGFTLLLLVVTSIAHAAAPQQSLPRLREIAAHKDDWFTTDEGKRTIDNIITWQNQNGGWWKFYDPNSSRPAELPPSSTTNGPPGDTEEDWRRTSTFDNNATTLEMRLLARAIRINKDDGVRESFNRGLAFIHQSQYQSGGWPQRYPVEQNYGRHITFNDDAMTHVMLLLNDISTAEGDFTFIPQSERTRARESFNRGVDCILKCQITVNGKLTAWCQQHDADTLAPTGARTYELPSLSGGESGDIALMLMKIPDPDERVRKSIEAVARWYEASALKDIRIDRVEGPQYENGRDRFVVKDSGAKPVWARFYEIETNKPIFVDRDGVVHSAMSDIGWERRNLYAWYGKWGEGVLHEYPKWKQRLSTTAGQSMEERNAPPAASRAVTVAQDGSGNFKSIQEAIDSTDGSTTIHIKPGTYKERITIPKSKPGISLVATDPDPTRTILTFDLVASTILPGTTQPIGTSGTPSTSIEADDFTARNITFENSAGDRGQAVAIKITGDRCAFYNCRFLGWQDTLYTEAGRHYFQKCYIEGRVDFIFGGSIAVFDRCTIHSKNGGYITAARTPPDQKFGFVFLDCCLSGEGEHAYLGRPWQWDRGRVASVTFIRTAIGPHIRDEGWNRWDRPNNPNTTPEKNTRYSEFASRNFDDHPIDAKKRVPWSHQLTAEQASKYTIENVFSGVVASATTSSSAWIPDVPKEAK